MTTIYPSILTDSLFVAQQQIEMMVPFLGQIRTIQMDILDGLFADNITMSPVDLLSLDFHSFSTDIHLMTVDPIEYVVECAQVPSLRTAIGQVERMDSQEAFIEHVKSFEKRVGLSMDLYTPMNEIEEKSWSVIDCVQIMSIHAGFQGQDFETIAVQKIKDTVKKVAALDRPIEIIVDGGVGLDTIRTCIEAGAQACTIGSEIWTSNDLPKTMRELFLAAA